MSQRQVSESEGLFNTGLFVALLIAGVFIGSAVCAHVIPDMASAKIVGLSMLPLGVIAGISFGSGAAPPMSILNLFSVFDGRHTVEDVIKRGGGTGGTASLAMAIVVATPVVCGAFAALVSTFLKPAATLGALEFWFAGSGLLYGFVAAAVVWFAAGSD